MHKPETPADEADRLDALHALHVLDSEGEERFDRLTRMARRLFGVPIALVSLVDANRQWFKSCMGLEVRETPRDISFCGHAILGDELFVIPDAAADERFADNPLVTGEPRIRFYAGHPLRAPTGHKMGTLCIIDREPRTLGTEDAAVMKDLAAMAERELAALHLATTDELTRLSNRRGFRNLARHSLAFCDRHDVPAVLVYFDLNGFKPINDRFGHAEGDRALVAFANQMKAVFRDSDVFGRLGGDEFAVLLTNTPEHEAERSVERFRAALDEHNRIAARGYDIAFSCGMAPFDPRRHDGIDPLLAEADERMYRDKKQEGDGGMKG